jgi:hypothetical protein
MKNLGDAENGFFLPQRDVCPIAHVSNSLSRLAHVVPGTGTWYGTSLVVLCTDDKQCT